MTRVLHFYGASPSLALSEVDWLLLLGVPFAFIYIHCPAYTSRRVSCLRIDFIVSCLIFTNTLMSPFLAVLCLTR
jgi:hypothetical protein